ncbi:hypothetical protein AB1N83_011189 [Pleurotus pulmonarius]
MVRRVIGRLSMQSYLSFRNDLSVSQARSSLRAPSCYAVLLGSFVKEKSRLIFSFYGSNMSRADITSVVCEFLLPVPDDASGERLLPERQYKNERLAGSSRLLFLCIQVRLVGRRTFRNALPAWGSDSGRLAVAPASKRSPRMAMTASRKIRHDTPMT